MVEKIFRYLLLSIIGICAIVFVASFFLEDETIEKFAGPVSGPLINTRTEIATVAAERLDSLFFWARTTFADLTDFSDRGNVPSVVMRIPPPSPDLATPPPEGALPPAPESSPATPPTPAPAEPSLNETNRLQGGALDTETSDPAEPQPSSMIGEASSAEENTRTSEPPEPPPDAAPMPLPSATDLLANSNTGPTDNLPPPPPAVPTTDVQEQPVSLPDSTSPASEPDAALAALSPAEPAPAPPGAETDENVSPFDDGPPPPPTAMEVENPGEADYQQGLAYYNGDGVERNFGLAAQAFLRAAEAGHTGAQYNLGIMNYVGQTGGQDFANAAKWFEAAANDGHAQAQYNLGFLYYEGKGVGQDLRTAFGWIDRAAEQGYDKAIRARDQFRQLMPEMFESAPAS